jgi:hypothetical protein
MPRKANNFSTMSLETLEQLFTAIQERFAEQDQLIQYRFDEQDKKFFEQDKKLESILSVVKFYDIERKDVKSTLWEHEIRLNKLEKHTV